jgi:hypothetical protein
MIGKMVVAGGAMVGAKMVMRYIYRLIPLILIGALLYMGSGWIRETFFQVKDTVLLESTKWEMNTLRGQFEFCLKFRPDDLATFPIFVERSFDEEDREQVIYDGWDTAYHYGFDAEKGVYLLQSAGPDGEFGTNDDLIVTNRRGK